MVQLIPSFTGLRSSTAAPGTTDKLKIKEKKFDNRITLTENLDCNRQKNLRPKSAAPTADYDPTAYPVPAPKKKKRQYRRCLDTAMPDEDVILRGLYKFDDRQAKIYEDFVRMLAGFDHYDAVRGMRYCMLFELMCVLFYKRIG